MFVASTKKNLITYLLLIALLLLIVNVVLDLFKPETTKPNAKELTRAQIENTFWKVLDDYGVDDAWVKKKKFHVEDEDSINAQFFVTLPAEIPIPYNKRY